MDTIAIILRKMPYGAVNAAEALRHALGGVTNGFNIQMLLVDSGILLAKKGQEDAGTDFTNLGNTLKDCLAAGVDIYVDKHSISEHQIELSEIIDGVKIVNGNEIADLITEAKQTIIF